MNCSAYDCVIQSVFAIATESANGGPDGDIMNNYEVGVTLAIISRCGYAIKYIQMLALPGATEYCLWRQFSLAR